MTYLYLLLNVFTISFPLVRSFEHRVAYAKKWHALFPGILAGMALFIPWDVLFTQAGFWGFNPRYLTGINLFGLPIEECLFFLTVPFSCVFIYECLVYFVKKDVLGNAKMVIGTVLLVLCAAMLVLFFDRWYTATTFGLLAFLLVLHLFVLRTVWLGRFFLAYAVILIPFMLVNGVLTGTGIEEEVVWYNPMQHWGMRIATVPFEDAFYGMALILLNVSVYEWILKRWPRQSA